MDRKPSVWTPMRKPPEPELVFDSQVLRPGVPVAPPRRVSRWTKQRIIKTIALVILAVGLAAGGWLGWKFFSNLSKTTKGNLFGLLADTPLKGESNGRVTILLAGNSADDPGHGGSGLTDSIMLVSLDTKNHTAFTMSIPRDLWVNVPGHGYEKINAAYVNGEADGFNESGYAAGGMGLLEKVVEQDFGVDINYEALVNYTAFKQAVTAVGGIDVTIASSDSRGIYDPNIDKSMGGPLRLKNGPQHLDGQTALNLARARNDPTPDGRTGYGLPRGDFDRAANQRLMLAALKTKIFSSDTYANPLKLSNLMDALGNNVTTDFKTNELQRLYKVMKAIDTTKMDSLSLVDKNLITDFTATGGQSALVPSAGPTDYSQIQAYLRQLTSSDPVVREGATIVVLNGSGITGLAKQEATALKAKGLNVVSYDTAPTPATTTTIIDNSQGKKSATITRLKTLVQHATAGTNAALSKAYSTADVIVVLGADQPQPSSSPSSSASQN